MKQLLHYLITHFPFYNIKRLASDFIKCGITGWCMEILFTAFNSFKRREPELMGNTSIWMFPIYGSISLLKPLFFFMKRFPTFIRSTAYAFSIFTGEYLSGKLLSKYNCCPWNYKRSKWHINEIIRLDFFPYWCVAGLLFEKILFPKTVKYNAKSNTRKKL